MLQKLLNDLKWQVPEYPQYERGWFWYLGAAAAGIALLIYAVVSGNFLFALIIIFGIVISVAASWRPPKIVELRLYEEGVKLDDVYYPWEKFQSYWVVKDEEITNLGLDLKNWLRTDIYVPIKDYSLEEVEKFLSQYLKKNPDRKEEPISYFLGRKLKI